MAGGLLDNPLQYRETQPLAWPHASEAVPGLPAGYEGLPLDQAAEMAGAERGRTAGQLEQMRGTVGGLPPLVRALLRARGLPTQLR